ncbi:MAG: hypothetical protein ACC661_08370, partial [Verrucomicrobiales bacterium]
LIQLDTDSISRALKIEPDSIFSPGGFYVSLDRWKKDEFVFEVFFTVAIDPDRDKFEEINALIAWDLNSKKLRKIKGSKSKE